jgi:hypothetical protein
MNRFTLAAAVAALVAGTASAQPSTPDVPKHKCEPKPVLPGPRMMSDDSVRKRFQREIDAYKSCMKAYADERAAAAKAHTDAGNAAISEYNDTMKALQEAQQR